MYFIPQPRKIEYKEAEEGQNGFVLSYQGYIVLDPSCGDRLTRQAALVQKALEEKLGFALALTRGDCVTISKKHNSYMNRRTTDVIHINQRNNPYR